MLTNVLAATEFNAPTIDWSLLVPLLIVAGAGVLSVLVEAFVPTRARRFTQIVIVIGAQIAALLSVVTLLVGHNDELKQSFLWPVTRLSQDGSQAVGQSFIVDSISLSAMVVILIASILASLVLIDRTSARQDPFASTAAAVPGTEYEDLASAKGVQQTEVFPLFLFALTGMLVFPGAADMITMFIALELLSLPLYALTAMARRRRLLSQEAAFKYFVLGSFASAMFLFGAALLYGYSGSLSIVQIAGAAQSHNQSGQMAEYSALFIIGVVLVLAGVLFKVGAVPFQAWTPDVYQGAPTPVTGFMAACTKIAATIVLIRIVLFFVLVPGGEPSVAIEKGLWVVAIATMLVGTVAGLTQTDVKRMLAYSSIGHTGFMLVAILGFNGGAPLTAIMFYLLVYGIATVGAFAVVTLVREIGPEGEVLGEANHIGQWAGLAKRSPFLAAAFSIFLLSFAGIPGTAGFIAKFSAFSSAAKGDATALVIVGVLASAISLFFYIRVIVLMYFVAPAEESLIVDDSTAPVPNAADPAEDRDMVAELDLASSAARTSVVTLESNTSVGVVKSNGAALAVIAVSVVAIIGLGLFPSGVLSAFSDLFAMWG